MNNIIEVRNLIFKYQKTDERHQLNDISFHVKHGEWLSIIGHNGSGKSTVVRLIDGLLEPESGEIYISGDLLTPENVWEKRSEIGMVFQNPDNQFVGATVEDDVAFGLENQGIPRDEMVRRVDEALKMVRMDEFKDREPARLSGGQKQRVAIAGIIALRPKIIILDEATSMLDPEGRLELIRTVREVKQRYGLTVISITHDLEEVSLSDRVILFEKGKATLDLTPRELFSRDDLDEIGLEEPFANRLRSMLHQKGFPVGETYQTEGELEKLLWELL